MPFCLAGLGEGLRVDDSDPLTVRLSITVFECGAAEYDALDVWVSEGDQKQISEIVCKS